MSDAALAFGISGTALSVLSLGWQFYSFRLSGARPHLTPVIAANYGSGAFGIDATEDARPTLLAIEEQLNADPADRIIGVTVVNKGRSDLRVTRWELRVMPAGARHFLRTAPGSPAIPCTIEPGGEETFFTPAEAVRAAAMLARAYGSRQRLVMTITSGGRTYESAPIYTPMLTNGDD